MQVNLIYITDFWTGPVDVEQAAIGELGVVTALGAHDESELLPRIADAAGLLVWHDIRIGAATLSALKQCRVLVRIGVGFDNVDREAAARLGIPVCNVPDYGTEDVADHAIAMLLALVRSLPQLGAEVRSTPPRWNARSPRRSPRLRGMTFGVVGLGRIGTATALRAKAFGMEVIAFDPYIQDGRDKAIGVHRADSLGELVAQADVLSLHTPLTPETRGMVNAELRAPAGRA